ncbi:MAG: hypothetical protein LBT62_05265, partial [Deltaproteobacteria bacterium]|nr:hypothetical protein [Deltaproteobacteria bacterium]
MSGSRVTTAMMRSATASSISDSSLKSLLDAMFKDDKRELRSPDDWLIFENTRPAIVDQNAWDTVQRCGTVKRKGDAMGEVNPLTCLLYCNCAPRNSNR